LGLSILIASFAHGYAQIRRDAAPDEVFAVVICADGTTQTVLLDQNGDPVDPSHCLPELCSACLTPQLLANASQQDAAPRLVASHRVSFPAASVAATAPRPASDPRPRGPPATT
jgi:hypothetical protein